MLVPLALVAGLATLVGAVTSFALSQVLGVAAQRSITEMRRRVEAHVARLPVRYFDSTQSGVLISRIMTDAEGIRNLVGSGLVQLVGSVVTAIAALAYLFYLNWYLTSITIVALAAFGGAGAVCSAQYSAANSAIAAKSCRARTGSACRGIGGTQVRPK